MLKPWVDVGYVGDNLRTFSEAELETATRLSNSVARWLVFGAVKTPEHELEVVIDGSVAHALSSRGREGRRLLLLSLDLGEDSLRGTWWECGANVAILTMIVRACEMDCSFTVVN